MSTNSSTLSPATRATLAVVALGLAVGASVAGVVASESSAASSPGAAVSLDAAPASEPGPLYW